MKRRIEPELMDGEEQARAYAEADFSEPNERFLQLLAELEPGTLDGARALDLGCGPGDIVVRFLRKYPGACCDALDGSAAMLAQARQALDALPGLAPRCRLLCHTLPRAELAGTDYDLILSNSLLHHLHDPQVLWRTIRESARPGALVLVMDLMRPASAGWAEAIVESYAGNEPKILKSDFRHSLYAAFEPREVQDQLAEAGLRMLEVGVVSDRHLAVSGRLPG